MGWRHYLGDVFHTNEVEQSFYNFQVADTALLFDLFDKYEAEAKRVIELGYIRPAYDYVLKCSHASTCWIPAEHQRK